MKPVKSKLANAVKVLAVTATVAFSVNATAAAPQKDIRFVGETQFAGFCKAVINDDVRVLRSSLSRNVGRIGATCNGSSLIEFSVERHADAVHEYLTSRS